MSQKDYDDGYYAAKLHQQQKEVWSHHGEMLGKSVGDLGSAVGDLLGTLGSLFQRPRSEPEAWAEGPKDFFAGLGKKCFFAAILGAIGFFIWGSNGSTMEPGAAAVLGLIIGGLVPLALAILFVILRIVFRVAIFLLKVAFVVGAIAGLIAFVVYATGNWH